uniref:HAT C-terminal dimerisation domain-containing protein n=1 Tax=Acanthochromis polyacanthus TaxID=80966 RepID=A0A3Q1FJK1_9TELE
MCSYLESRKERHKELSDDAWLPDLGFLTDLTAKMNELNTEFAVSAFKAKLSLWVSQLRNGKLTHFPNQKRLSNNVREAHPEQFCVHLDKVRAEFDRCFQEMHKTENIVRFISNPFIPTDIEAVAAQLQETFSVSNDVDIEIINMQKDTELQARDNDRHLWGLVNREKFPLFSSCAVKVKSYFGFTYLCEVKFSHMKIIKSKHRARLTDRQLANCVRPGVSNYEQIESNPLNGELDQNKPEARVKEG